jgi:hypothetical protein
MAFALLSFGLCASATAEQPASDTSVALERLIQAARPYSEYSQLTEPAEQTIMDAAVWSQFKQQAGIAALTHSSDIDFTRKIALVATLGTRSTGGYSIRIDHAEARANYIEVVIAVSEPGPGCMVTQSTTQPVDIALIDRTTLPIRFIKSVSTRRCF